MFKTDIILWGRCGAGFINAGFSMVPDRCAPQLTRYLHTFWPYSSVLLLFWAQIEVGNIPLGREFVEIELCFSLT